MGHPAGPGDLIGWTKVVITADMVGHVIPVFSSFECKPTERPHYRDSQLHFSSVVKEAGGIAGIVNSPEEAQAVYDDFFRRFDQRLI